MRLLPLYIAGSALIIIPVFAYYSFSRPELCGLGDIATMRAPKQTITVSVAKTTKQQSRGLGGCTALAHKTGMYFPFQAVGPQTFWMKDMVIPIDMVWLLKGKVVGVDTNIPAPLKNTDDTRLLLYHSPQDVDAMLEVGAGTAEGYGLKKGAQLVFVN